MAKYPGFYSTKDVCKAEVKECREILKRYKVPKEEIKNITDMIEQAYLMLSESYRMGRCVDAYIEDELGEDALADFMAKCVSHTKEPGPKLQGVLLKEAEDYIKQMDKEDNFKRIK